MPKPLTSGIVWLNQSVQADMIAQGSQHAPNETGGLLIGYRHTESETVITGIIGPGPGARHLPKTFIPDTDWQAQELADRYDKAARRIQYLGDWHTHPGGNTSLSRTDKQTLRTIASYRDARCPTPLMIVIAGQEEWNLAVHQINPRSLGRSRIEKLIIQMFT